MDNYYSQIRYDLIDWVDGKNNSVLEIGCGQGNTLRELKKQGKAKFIAGIDIHKKSIKKATQVLDKTICANIEVIKLPFKTNQFDYIILADVLEHLINPQAVLEKLKPFLKNNGYLLISLPNIRNIKIGWNLIKGNWQYQEKGILDQTHLRFFTQNSAVEIFNKCGLKVVEFKDNTPELNKCLTLLNLLALGKLKPWYTIQWLFKLQKIS